MPSDARPSALRIIHSFYQQKKSRLCFVSVDNHMETVDNSPLKELLNY